jgi:hypothetical protein
MHDPSSWHVRVQPTTRDIAPQTRTHLSQPPDERIKFLVNKARLPYEVSGRVRNDERETWHVHGRG